MNKPAWEEFADYEKNDSTYDGIPIPYEADCDEKKSRRYKIILLEAGDCESVIHLFRRHRIKYTRKGKTFYFLEEEGIYAKTLLDEEVFAFEWDTL